MLTGNKEAKSFPMAQLKDIITTPYMKVLSILKEAKKYISITSHSESKLIKQIEWSIKVIMSHSLYTYEIEDNEFISKYQQENDEFRQFVEFVSDYNEEVIEVNKKSNLVLTKTAQMKNDINMLQTPSLIIKKQNIVFNNGRILKKRSLNSNFNLKTSNTTKLSLNSLKQVMKNGCNFLTNSANSILPNSLSPINNHSKEHTNKFVLSKGIISLNNKFHRNNIIDDNLSESPLKQIHHRLLTPLLIDSSFDRIGADIPSSQVGFIKGLMFLSKCFLLYIIQLIMQRTIWKNGKKWLKSIERQDGHQERRKNV